MQHSQTTRCSLSKWLGLLLLVVAAAGPAFGQDAPAAGGYTFSGSVGFGYRFQDVNGSRAKYNQLLNLQQGFRVFDTQLDFLSKETGKGWFDRLTVSAQDLGGDPFPVIGLQLRKHGLYELRIGYRATQYFLDLPQTAFTPNHAWIDRRRFSDLEFRYTPSTDLRLRFFYNRTERDGSDLSGSPFFYIPLGPDVWGAFGRANSLPWVTPLREKANLFGLGADYRLAKTNFHVEQSFRRYDNPASTGGLAGQPLQLLGPLSPFQNLVIQNWIGSSHLDIPTTSIHFDSEAISRLQLRGGYVYTHASGPADLDGTVLSPTGVSLPPIVLSIIGRGDTNLTNHTAEFGFTLKLLSQLDFLSDYRYQTSRQEGNRTLKASRADFPAPVALGDENQRWDYGLHTLETQLAFVPTETVRIQAGLRFLKQDVTHKADGQADFGTQRTWSYAPIVRVSWKPNARLFVRGNFESRTVVDPYTRITPEDTRGSSIRAQYSFAKAWRVDNVWSFRNFETTSLGLLMHTRTNSTTLTYSPESLLGFYGGFTYDSFSSKNSVIFQQGLPPLTGLISSDQTIDREYFSGLKVNPLPKLVIDLSGQFVRSTGLGTFTGEASNYGPLTWSGWNGELSYDVPRTGRFALGWQRSYYLENLNRATDYSANGFTLRFDRHF